MREAWHKNFALRFCAVASDSDELLQCCTRACELVQQPQAVVSGYLVIARSASTVLPLWALHCDVADAHCA